MGPVSFRRVGQVPSSWRGRHCASTFRLHTARAAANGKDVPDGDKETQEALVDMIRLNVNKSRFLEQLDAFTDMEKRKIRHQAAEVNQHIDEYEESNAARIDDKFQAASAEIDKQYQAVHDDLQKSRERLEADTTSFKALRAKVQADRQAGLFYKTLYTDPLAKDAPQYQVGFHRARKAAAEAQRTRGAERFLWRFSLIYILASLASLGSHEQTALRTRGRWGNSVDWNDDSTKRHRSMRHIVAEWTAVSTAEAVNSTRKLMHVLYHVSFLAMSMWVANERTCGLVGMEQAAEWKAWFVPIAAAIWMVAYWLRRPQL